MSLDCNTNGADVTICDSALLLVMNVQTRLSSTAVRMRENRARLNPMHVALSSLRYADMLSWTRTCLLPPFKLLSTKRILTETEDCMLPINRKTRHTVEFEA